MNANFSSKGIILLNHLGLTPSIAAAERPALTRKLELLIEAPGFTESVPGGPTRCWLRSRKSSHGMSKNSDPPLRDHLYSLNRPAELDLGNS